MFIFNFKKLCNFKLIQNRGNLIVDPKSIPKDPDSMTPREYTATYICPKCGADANFTSCHCMEEY